MQIGLWMDYIAQLIETIAFRWKKNTPIYANINKMLLLWLTHTAILC